MKSKQYVALGLVVGGSFALMGATGVGCGGTATTGTSTGGASSSTTTSTTGSPTSSSSAVTVGVGGSGGSGGSGGGTGGAPTTNTTQASATTITVNGMAFTGIAQDGSTADWYTFTATAGERIYIGANAVDIINPAPAATESYIIDTVVTLYDSTGMKVLAQDDDAYPRSNTDSQLFFVVPTTGTYYYTVEACAAAFPSGCGTENPTDFAYQTFVADVGKLLGTTEGSLVYNITEVYAGTSQDGTTAKAVPIAYTLKAGAANISAVDGDAFTASANTHVFSFTPPAALMPTAGSRLRTDLWLQPVGTANGDGSTGNMTAWITKADGTTILGQADQANYKDGDNFGDGPLDLSVPVTSGSQYFLFVKDDNAAPTASDFYFFLHTVGSGNPVQVAGGTNTSAATAQKLVSPSAQPGAFFVDGDITAVATQYWYEVDPPTGAKSVFASCGSARAGSGVQGFTMDLMAQAGAGAPTSFVPASTTKTETATADLSIPVATATAGLAIPTGTTKAFLVVSATGQSATNTGTAYQCGVNYQ